VGDPIPIYFAASGPKALRVLGELGDGWITPLPTPERLTEGLAAIRAVAQQQGRQLGDLYVMAPTTVCVTRPGESLLSSRVVARVGPRAIMLYHKPGEERFLSEALMKRGGLIGSGEEIVAQLKALEQTGLRQIAVQVVTNGRELIARYR
jgi:alkanesulfonate monooxygenase SsuD/methylene tetrahydromethanopterin reductase-like flavin-dependent oxidoreductase (luciferase family)